MTNSPSAPRRRGGIVAVILLTVLGSAAWVVSAPPAAAATCGSGSYTAEAVLTGSTWTARAGTRTLYTGTSMYEAMRRAVAGLTPGRTTKQAVVVRGSGSMGLGQGLSLPSHTALEVCGTITVTGGGRGNNEAIVHIRNVSDVDVPHLTIAGSLYFGILIRNSSDVHLGEVNLRMGAAGLGIRIDNNSNRALRTRDVRIDNVTASGGGSHGVETYGVDGLTIGTVTARNTGEAGLLLNDTINATIGTVDAIGAGTGTGYAAFRMANRNGRIGTAYPTNIRVGQVIARGGGRGIFCVSESGGVTIERVDIAGTGNNAILIENCHNVTIATVSGTVNDNDIRIGSRSTLPVSSNVTIQNLTATNSAITESPCGSNDVVRLNRLVNTRLRLCSGTNGGGNVTG